MYIVFLDIDGVLNTGIYTGSKFEKNFNTICVNAFNRLINTTGAKVVITSSNRIKGIDHLRKWFKEQKVECEIIDSTPYAMHFNNRGEEIDAWIRVNGMPERFVIIDDKNENIADYFDKQFIRTESKVGFLEKHCDKAIALLLDEK